MRFILSIDRKIGGSKTVANQAQTKGLIMKTKLITLALVITSVSAFAQGKISFLNDSLHLLYFSSFLKSADSGLAGQLVTSAPMPSGATLLVDLYGGTNSSSMVLQTTVTFSATPGLFGPVGVTSPNLPGGQVATMQVQIRESTFATADLAYLGGGYSGYSQIFTMVPGSTIAFNTIVNHGGTALSTWADGDFYFPVLAPEPSSLSLVGFGVATLLIYRRRR